MATVVKPLVMKTRVAMDLTVVGLIIMIRINTVNPIPGMILISRVAAGAAMNGVLLITWDGGIIRIITVAIHPHVLRLPGVKTL